MRQRTDRQATNGAEVNKEKMGIFRVYMLVASAATLCIVGQAFGLECAVCLPSDESSSIGKDIRRDFPDDHSNLIGCHQLNETDEHAIIKTCPENSASCHIQKTKEWTAKTCSKISVDDCKTANRVKYCYCRSSRCNMQITNATTTTTTQSTGKVEHTTSISNNTTATNEVHQLTTKATDSGSSLNKSEYWLMFFCLLIISYRIF